MMMIIFTISFLQSNETWPFSLPTICYCLVPATHCGVVALKCNSLTLFDHNNDTAHSAFTF